MANDDEDERALRETRALWARTRFAKAGDSGADDVGRHLGGGRQVRPVLVYPRVM